MSSKRDVFISKTLSRILRHGATREGIQITSEGYVLVDEILNHPKYKGQFTVDDIKNVVKSNDKQRFTLKESSGGLQIKANQGHSLTEVNELSLCPITTPVTYDVIHGTYFKSWDNIKKIGLSRMNRNHIHFAKGLPQNKTVISGMRTTAQIYIYIDLKLALDDNLHFFESENGVILCPGDETGIIKPKYFKKVLTSKGLVLSV